MNRTFVELIDFAKRSGWTDLSDKGLELLGVRINSAIQMLAAMRPWPFYQADAPGCMQLKAPYSTGTVTVVEGSAAVTGSATAWTTAMAGQEFVGPDARAYTIDSWSSPTGLVLAEPYLGTGAAAAAYSVRYVRYAMPTSCIRVGRMKHRTCGWLNDGRDMADFWAARTEIHQQSQAPDTVWKKRPYFYVNPSPTAAEQVRFPYWTAPTRLLLVTDEIDWPAELDWLLFAALGLAVREKTEHDAAAVLYAPAFQQFVATAYRQADSSAEPLRLAAGRPDAGETWQEFQSHFQIEPDV